MRSKRITARRAKYGVSGTVDWGLHGDVTVEQFQRLSEGQHPITGEQLVRHQTPREYTNERGEQIRTMEHHA